MNFEKKVIQIIKESMPKGVDFIETTLSVPPDIKLGDYAIPCFPYTKELKKNPNEIAVEISANINNNLDKTLDGVKFCDIIQKTELKGPYINIFLNKKYFSRVILTEIDNQQYNFGSENKKNQNIVIDYSAPNVAKNMGIHNLRSTIIGQSLYNIYEKLGYNVIGVNHLGDWGTQFGKLIWAVKKWSSPEEIKQKGIVFLNELYVKFHNEYEKTKDESMIEKSREYFRDIESKEPYATNLWKLFIDISMQDYNKIYERLNVKFDYNTGESFYIQFLDETIKQLKKANITTIDQGALVVKFDDEENMPPCLLKKSDGATLYATRDVAAALYRLKTYNPKKILYVTDIAQNLHFQQWFRVLEKLKPETKDILEHVNFGRLSFANSQMSTRKGNIIPLREVLDKAQEKALKLIQEKSPDLENSSQVAQKVGIGAVIYEDLLHDRIHNIIFDWDKVLDFQGETAPYIQYTYARIKSILRKDKVDIKPAQIKFENLTDDISFTLIKKLSEYNSYLNKAMQQNKPSILARYVLELAQMLNSFYVSSPILNQETKIKNSRLFLIEQTSKVIKDAMRLLNIDVPEKM